MNKTTTGQSLAEAKIAEDATAVHDVPPGGADEHLGKSISFISYLSIFRLIIVKVD